MTIGEALREVQLEMGLTAKEMAAGVISKGNYSKVINNKIGISSDRLFKILFNNDIDIEKFTNKICSSYKPDKKSFEEKLSLKIRDAFNNRNVEAMKEYLVKAEDFKCNKYLIQRLKIAIAFLENNLSNLSENFKTEITNELNNENNWTENIDALRLFSSSMQIMDPEKVDIEIKLFLKRIRRIDYISEIMRERYAIICSNYLHWKYKSKAYNNNFIEQILQELISLTQNDYHLMIYNITGKYYKYLFLNKKSKAKKIKLELADLGFAHLIKNLPE